MQIKVFLLKRRREDELIKQGGAGRRGDEQREEERKRKGKGREEGNERGGKVKGKEKVKERRGHEEKRGGRERGNAM